jgi:dolichol-phosphate mannosyltransferase
MPFRDCTSGFQCLSRRALGAIGLESIRTNGYSFLIELKYRVIDAGLRGVEVPIVFTQRRAGTSKISKAEIGRSMVTPWKMRLGFWDGGPRAKS